MLLIVDNQNVFVKKFKRQFLSEQDFDYVFLDHKQSVALPDKSKIKGIILSGGKSNSYESLYLTSNFVALMNFDAPILRFCLRH